MTTEDKWLDGELDRVREMVRLDMAEEKSIRRDVEDAACLKRLDLLFWLGVFGMVVVVGALAVLGLLCLLHGL